jgi:hypothetical protein
MIELLMNTGEHSERAPLGVHITSQACGPKEVFGFVELELSNGVPQELQRNWIRDQWQSICCRQV